LTNLSAVASSIRCRILDTAFRAGKGHIGSALSICEIICAVAHSAKDFGTNHPMRDRVVLSKGHASLALYCTMVEMGRLPPISLDTYCKDDSLLQTHPDQSLVGVDFSTGSLGQGIGFGVGTALAAKVQGRHYRSFVVLSDSELNEGSTWEAVAIAGTQELATLTVILDLNGQQALGRTNEVLKMGDPRSVWVNLGWSVTEVDGHDVELLAELLSQQSTSSKPRLIIAHTTSGKGVSYMEREIKWHYLPMSSSQYEQAMQEQNRP
jgi:transketolase